MKSICMAGHCTWRGDSAELLSAANPFDELDTITGCPDCKNIDCVVTACDEPECWKQATCGTPTPDGYRHTCGKHIPHKGRDSYYTTRERSKEE